MPSGWDVYYIVFLSAGLALGIPAALALVSLVVARGKKRPGTPSRPHPAGEEPGTERTLLGQRINTRVFLAVNAALVLLALVLVLIPCVVDVREGTDPAILFRGLAGILTGALFAFMGLLYASRKGDLSWLTSFQAQEKKK